MNTVQRIAKNAGVLFVSQAISFLLGFLYVMYTARYLKAEGFGILSFALAFTAIFGVFADFGLVRLTVREVARDKSLASKYLANISVMKGILAIITFGLIALVVNLLGYPQHTVKVVYLIALSVILTAFTRMLYSIFQAFEKMEYQSLGQILHGVLMLLGVIVAIKFHLSVIGFAFIYFIASLMVLGYNFIILRWKFTKLVSTSVTNVLEIDWSFWKQSIKEAWPMGGMAIGIMIYFRTDAVMLSLMKGDTAVGLYSAAYKLSEVSTMIPAMFMASVFPVMAKFHKGARDSFASTYGKSVKYLLYLAVPMALTVTLLARPIVNLIFRNEFSGSVIALQILIWAAAIMYVTMVLGTTIVTANKQILSLKLTIAAAILNIILNLIMIPRYSYVGASATTVATEAFGLLAGIFFLNRYGYKLNITTTCVPPLLGLSAAGIAAIILINLGISVLIISTVAILMYGVIIYKTGIKEDDRQLIKKMLNF